MSEVQSSCTGPQTRLLITCPYSGSTTDSPQDNDSTVNAGKHFVIHVKEIGESNLKKCDIFPTSHAYIAARPVFLIRDPIRVFDSWKNSGRTDTQDLINCFTNLFRNLDQTPNNAAPFLVYEQVIRDPRNEIKRLCAWWGVPFSETTIGSKKQSDSSLSVANHDNQSTIIEASSFEVEIPYHNLLTNSEKDDIEERVGNLYLRCWNDDVHRLQAILAEKTWFGFDLDDTLHEFRRSSGKAMNEVFESISGRYDIPIPALKGEYSKILKEKTADAFSDGKTSHDYRRERFTSLITHFSASTDNEFLAELLQLYETTLMQSLELKSGALGLLSTIKKAGKKIVVITEGPQDAQERTIKGLGIGGYVDFLATTNRFRDTKINGLFPKVLNHLGISSRDMVYIGDNEQRDMNPAMAEGIFSIHLAEAEHVSLNTSPPRINTLNKLRHILLSSIP
ncbi:HAD-like domain-containing protein [Hypoxylon trugodes]|uniref:HAD-like domain-containing protein n=1 Tax=Hypoxylon trugodes TaxID=326681 RepID=UPI0021944FA9|nr:HAD-like domain-containing protein [Hypoxylon trugodes]KAI1385896.1 HAD-like domain-containing protein [Hypoxylon trugodes]